MTPTLQHLNEKWTYLIKEKRCFSCKERGYTVYDYLKKRKIATISEGLIEDNSSQEKTSFFWSQNKEPFYFIIIYIRRPILQKFFSYFMYTRK